MKKLLILCLLPVVCFGIVVIGAMATYNELVGGITVLFGGSDSDGSDDDTCRYLSDDMTFSERVETHRDFVKDSEINKEYLNIVLGIMEYDETADIESVTTQVITIIKRGYVDPKEILQIYKYGFDYVDYLESINESHTLSTSRKYFKEKYEHKETDPEAYAFFMKVLGKINADCDIVVPTGDWIVPLETPYIVSSDFLDEEYQSVIGNKHYGVDVVYNGGDTIGKAVYAVTDGVITDIGNACGADDGYLGNMCNDGKGNYVVIKVTGDTDIYVVTMHMSTVGVNIDDVVTVGQKIGEAGNSGNSTGAHVHIEMRTKPNQWGFKGESTLLNPHHFIEF